MASNSLIWELTKNYSTYLVKRKECATSFSTDPFNLTNKHNFKDSGLAHERSLGISLEAGVGNKKKGPKAVFKMIVKRKKEYIAKKAKPNKKRNLNSFCTQFLLKKGITKAAAVIYVDNIYY